MDRSTQTRILDSAAVCFGRSGYKKTSIDAVAHAAKVGKGTVYLYCASKEDLFYQSVHRELRQWIADLSKVIDPRRRADELLIEMAAADLHFLETHPLVRDLLFGLYHGLLPAWADRFDDLRQLGQKHIVELLELGIRQGIFACDLELDVTARALQDIYTGGALLGHRTRRDLADVRRQQVATLRLVMKGLEARKESA